MAQWLASVSRPATGDELRPWPPAMIAGTPRRPGAVRRRVRRNPGQFASSPAIIAGTLDVASHWPQFAGEFAGTRDSSPVRRRFVASSSQFAGELEAMRAVRRDAGAVRRRVRRNPSTSWPATGRSSPAVRQFAGTRDSSPVRRSSPEPGTVRRRVRQFAGDHCSVLQNVAAVASRNPVARRQYRTLYSRRRPWPRGA